ncbi:hypothetical protein, partial [Achromobacter xylosoxidans]
QEARDRSRAFFRPRPGFAGFFRSDKRQVSDFSLNNKRKLFTLASTNSSVDGAAAGWISSELREKVDAQVVVGGGAGRRG